MQVSGGADSKEDNKDQQEPSEREAWETKGTTEFTLNPVGIIKDSCICVCL